MNRLPALIAGLLPLTLLLGCANDAAPDEESGEAEVIGLLDLGKMETSLKLTKDVKDAQGHYSRADARLHAGGCYKKTVGAAPASYEFRRYTDGAAFFHKKGAAAAAADDRPVVCLDLDTEDANKHPITVLADRFELDMMVRYAMGREGLSFDSTHGESATTFASGQLDLMQAPNGATDSLDTPLFRGAEIRLVSSFKSHTEATFAADGSLAELAYRFAWRSAKETDVFTLADDPVGAWSETTLTQKGGTQVTQVKFARLDAWRLTSPTLDKLLIEPKLADEQLDARAIVSCTRTMRNDKPTSAFNCTGL